MSHPMLGNVEGFPVRQPWASRDGLARHASSLGLGLLLLLGTWLLVRRLAGAFEQSLDLPGFAAMALLLSVWSGGVRWGWRASREASPNGPVRPRHLFGILTTAGVLEFGAAVSLPGSSAGALGAFWCLLLASEAGWGFAFRARHSAEFSGGPEARNTEATPAVLNPSWLGGASTSTSAFPLIENSVADDTEELLAADESQRISRVRDSRGGEIISGLVRCSFEPGERQRDIHLAFCPPLRQVPHFSLEQVEGPPARIRTSLVESYGVGLEVKLASLSSEPESVQIQFFACEEVTAGELD